jgi:hypothetical protein
MASKGVIVNRMGYSAVQGILWYILNIILPQKSNANFVVKFLGILKEVKHMNFLLIALFLLHGIFFSVKFIVLIIRKFRLIQCARVSSSSLR